MGPVLPYSPLYVPNHICVIYHWLFETECMQTEHKETG